MDSCFANAGVGGGGAQFDAMTPDEWHRVFKVNMDGVMFTFREAVKHMKESGRGGSLVVTSSGTARFGAAGSEHYSATKAGVIALIQSLAVGQARYGIRANAIIPGWIETAMTERAFATEVFQTRVMRRIPQRRWGTPTDFRGIAVYFRERREFVPHRGHHRDRRRRFALLGVADTHFLGVADTRRPSPTACKPAPTCGGRNAAATMGRCLMPCREIVH